MIQKRIGILVIVLIGLIITLNLQAAENIAKSESEQIKLYEKAIQENSELSTVTSWFGSPEYLVKRYNTGKKEAESVWKKDQATIPKMKDLGTTQTLEILPLIDWYTSNEQLKGEPGVSYLIKIRFSGTPKSYDERKHSQFEPQ